MILPKKKTNKQVEKALENEEVDSTYFEFKNKGEWLDSEGIAQTAKIIRKLLNAKTATEVINAENEVEELCNYLEKKQ
jgi:hypothetical protein